MNLQSRVRNLEKKSNQGGNQDFFKNSDETDEEGLDRYCRENNISDAEREAHVWIAFTEREAGF